MKGLIFDDPAFGRVQIQAPPNEQFVFYRQRPTECDLPGPAERPAGMSPEFVCVIRLQPGLAVSRKPDSATTAEGIVFDEQSLRIKVVDGGRNVGERQAFRAAIAGGRLEDGAVCCTSSSKNCPT